MTRIMILNGPNLNMVGIREKGIYGNTGYEEMLEKIRQDAAARGVETDFRQSNHEGDLVDWIQEAYFRKYDGIVMNPGAYTHTSIAIADAVKAVAPLPVAEVHISDIQAREEFRHVSYAAPYCITQIRGHGIAGYTEGIDAILTVLRK